MSIVFWNEKFCSFEHVQIPFNDRGFLFGDGIFTTIRVENGHPIALENHLKKLQAQARLLKIEFPLIDPAWVDQLIQHNEAQAGIWRLKIILTGGGDEALHLKLNRRGQLIMTLKPYQGTHSQPVRLEDYPNPILSPLASLKTLSFLQRLQIKDYAIERGADDCLVRDAQGHILETAYANIFWIHGSGLYIPDPSLSYYFGVTLERVIAFVKHLSLCYVKVKKIPPDAHPYLCNSMRGICPIVQCGNQHFHRNLKHEEQIKI